MRDVFRCAELPRGTDRLKGAVAAIPERDVPDLERGELPAQPLPLHRIQVVLEPLEHIGIHDVPEMAIRDQDVLPAVEIDVEEHRAP